MNRDANNNIDMDPFVPQPVCDYCQFPFCNESCQLSATSSVASSPSYSSTATTTTIDAGALELIPSFDEEALLANLFPNNPLKVEEPIEFDVQLLEENHSTPLSSSPSPSVEVEKKKPSMKKKKKKMDDMLAPDERIMLCPVANCAFQTSRLYSMGSHIMNHRIKKEVMICHWQDCGHRAYTKDAIMSHYKLHSVEKSQCSQCEFWGGKMGSLLKHAQEVHGYPRVFKCKFENCKTVLKSQYGLDRHMSLHSVKMTL